MTFFNSSMLILENLIERGIKNISRKHKALAKQIPEVAATYLML